jgi:hypothetical protein
MITDSEMVIIHIIIGILLSIGIPLMYFVEKEKTKEQNKREESE